MASDDPIRAALERLIDALDAPAQVPVGRWTANVTAARAEARAALAEQRVEGPILQWTDNTPPCEECRYDHCTAETPFGRFLISWKSWKQFDSPTVDETPWGDWYGAFNSVDAAKAACQREMDERLARWGHQPTLSADDIPPGPFSEHELREQWNQQADEFNQWDSLDSYEQLAWAQARAIQRDRNARPTPPAEGEVAKPQKASTPDLTVKIQIDPSFECLQRLFDGLNAAVKPDGGYRAQTTDDPMVQTGCEQMVGVEWWLPQHGCDNSLENTLDAIKGRILAAILNWWPTATVSATQPPAEGEVAELVAKLRTKATTEHANGCDYSAVLLTRTAELLQQQHPTPVPVSERLLYCDRRPRLLFGH